ncbi:MAG: hypothetical protein FWE14_09860, partial [Lachnospiraceae bacterium]|nr:hypothetical protein [Lachnospiraceae bacterium]
IYQSLLTSALPVGLFAVLYQINPLINQRIYYYYFNRLNENNEFIFSKAEVWGNYYGIFLVIIGILTAFVSMIFMKSSRAISASWVREEHRAGKEQLMQAITGTIVAAVPLAALTAVLAEPIASLLEIGDKEITMKLLQSGSVLLVLFAFSYFWFDLLKQFKRTVQMLLLAGGGFLVHIISLIVIMPLINDVEQLIMGIIAANIIGASFSFVLGFFLVARMLKYQGEWINKNIRTLAITILCSAIAGLMALFLSKGILNLVGPAVTILICLVISIIAYFILMMLFRGLTVGELDRLPGGQLLIKIGRLFRFYY